MRQAQQVLVRVHWDAGVLRDAALDPSHDGVCPNLRKGRDAQPWGAGSESASKLAEQWATRRALTLPSKPSGPSRRVGVLKFGPPVGLAAHPPEMFTS